MSYISEGKLKTLRHGPPKLFSLRPPNHLEWFSASLRSPLELALYRQGGVQAHLISVASVNVPVLVVPPVFFAFPLTSPLELLGLDFVLFASPICHGLN